MGLFAKLVLTTISVLASTAAAATERGISTDGYSPKDIIITDVAILGGGASGTYAAIRLNDLGKSVVVVDRNNYLGGETYTYVDPKSGNTTEMGVVAWYNTTTVLNFFKLLGVELRTTDVARAGTTNLTTIPVDFRTGKVLTSIYTGNQTEGLLNYITQLAKYPYLEDSFDLPDPIPEDLLLPFGEFVEKYNVEGAIQILNIFGNGAGNFLELTTLYVFKLVSLEAMKALQENTYQATFTHNNKHNNKAPYEAAEKILGSKALLGSTILSVDRSSSVVKVHVQTPTGNKLIIAKKLLSTIPPKLENLVNWELDLNERALFGEFYSAGYYSAVINNTGIPDNIEVRNFGSDSPWNVPILPGPYFVQASDIAGHFTVKYCTPAPIGDANAKVQILDAIARLKTAGTLNTTVPEFVVFHSHSPFEVTVSVEAIKSGFYKKLYALQGKNKTWWTGATWHAQDSSKLWVFTEKLLPEIIKGL